MVNHVNLSLLVTSIADLERDILLGGHLTRCTMLPTALASVISLEILLANLVWNTKSLKMLILRSELSRPVS